MRGPLEDAVLDTTETGIDRIPLTILEEIFGDPIASVLKDLPVARWGLVLADVIKKTHDKKKAKRLIALYERLLVGTGKSELDALSDKDARKLKILVTDLMEHQVHDNQLKALSMLLDALADGRLDRRLFVGLMHELRNINPLVYEPDTEFVLGNTFKELTNINGPLHYLPASFYAHQGGKVAFTTHYLLTDLGEAFFKYAYEPVSRENGNVATKTDRQTS